MIATSSLANDIVAILGAAFAGIAMCITAWNQKSLREVHRKVDTNGDPRTIGEIATDVAQVVHSEPTQEQRDR